MILRFQWIQEWILKKSESSIMGADLEGDTGLDLSEDSSKSKGEDEEIDDVVMADGLLVVADGILDVEVTMTEELAAGIRGRTHSIVPTPTNIVDNDGGILIMAPEELHIAPVPPLQSTMQRSAKGAVMTTPLYETQQSAEGGVINTPHYQPRYAQTLFMSDMTTRPHQQLYLHRDFTALGLGMVVAQKQHAARQLGLVPAQ